MVEEIQKTWYRPGRKGFDIDYEAIGKLYLETEESLKSLANRFGVSQWTLLDRFKKLGIRRTTKRYQNDAVFSEFTDDSCYWAGFLAADGWISKNVLGVSLGIVDKEHLEKFILFLNGNNKIMEACKKSFNKMSEFCSVNISSKQIVNDLKNNFNFVNKKSLIYKPPTNLPENMMRHFIRGYIDGDGSIGWHKSNEKPRISICSGSKELLEWIFDNIKKNNKNAGNPKIKKRESNLYIVEFSGLQTYEILDWLYRDSTYYLNRKYERYVEYSLKCPILIQEV